MPLGSGFGSGPFGEDPFGQTNFARKILIENLPSPYVEADLEERDKGLSFNVVPGNPKFGKAGPFETFLRGLFPSTNEFRNKIDQFPLIRDPELLPKDDVVLQVLLENLKSEIQIVGETLPLIVPGNLITIIGDNPAETITVTVFFVDNALSRIQIGTPFPFATSVRTVKLRGESFRFLVTKGSDLIVAVPDVFPNVRVGDFVDVGDGIRRSVVRVTEDLFKFEVIPAPSVVPSPQRKKITRLSRLALLTLLAKDIGFTDDATKTEEIRRGLVLRAIEFYKLKGTRKGYQIKGALEGLLADIFNFQSLPHVRLTARYVPIAVGTIVTIDGSLINDGETVTVTDFVNGPKIFEFDKDGVAAGIDVPITDSMTAAQVADALADAINGVSLFNVKAEADENLVHLRNEAEGFDGVIPLSDTVLNPNFTVTGLLLYHGVSLLPENKTREPILYLSSFDVVPTDTIPMDSPSFSKYFDLGAPATGTITAIPGALISDGETFTISDGENSPSVFEFDKNGMVAPGRVRVAIDDAMTAEQVAVAIEEAVNKLYLSLRVTATHPTATPIVNLRNDTPGDSSRNVPIMDTVVDPGFVVSGMAGGVTGETEFFPVKFPDVNINFKVVGVRFKYDPGPGPNQITLLEEADLLAGDVVEFGSQQRIATVVPGSSPFADVPGFRIAGTIITFDAPLVGVSPGGTAYRVTRPPDISSNGDFLTVAGFDYKVVQYSNAMFSGAVDIVLRDTALVGTVLVAVRSRRRAVTRRQAYGFSRLPILKLHMKVVPESIFFSGSFESILRFVQMLDEVRPIHVRFEDIQFEQEIVIKVPIPNVTVTSELNAEMLVPVDAHFDSTPVDETSPMDATKVVTVET